MWLFVIAWLELSGLFDYLAAFYMYLMTLGLYIEELVHSNIQAYW